MPALAPGSGQHSASNTAPAGAPTTETLARVAAAAAAAKTEAPNWRQRVISVSL